MLLTGPILLLKAPLLISVCGFAQCHRLFEVLELSIPCFFSDDEILSESILYFSKTKTLPL